MKTKFNDFILEYKNNINSTMYLDYVNNLSIDKQLEVLNRGDKIIIKSNIKEPFIDIPLSFVKYNKIDNFLYVYDKNENIFKISINQPNKYKIELQ